MDEAQRGVLLVEVDPLRFGGLRQQGHAIRSDAIQMNGKRFAAYRIESGAVHES